MAINPNLSQLDATQVAQRSFDLAVDRIRSETLIQDPTSGNSATVQTFFNNDAQALGASSYGVLTGGSPLLYNGSTFDRERGNYDSGAVVTLTAASVSGTSIDQTNFNGRGIKVFVNVTAITGTTPSVVVSLQGKDSASGVYYNILSSASITAVGTAVLTIYPGLTASANVSANDILPRTWRISYTIAGTTPAVTATVGASVIV